MPGSSSTTNNGSTERPGFPPLRPSNKKSQGAQASRCATKRSRFGSSPCARISHITSHSRSGLWQRQNRPPKRVNRAPARTASESVHCASCRATRKGSCAQAAPARSGKYGGLTVTRSNSFSAADGLQSLKSPQPRTGGLPNGSKGYSCEIGHAPPAGSPSRLHGPACLPAPKKGQDSTSRSQIQRPLAPSRRGKIGQ